MRSFLSDRFLGGGPVTFVVWEGGFGGLCLPAGRPVTLLWEPLLRGKGDMMLYDLRLVFTEDLARVGGRLHLCVAEFLCTAFFLCVLLAGWSQHRFISNRHSTRYAVVVTAQVHAFDHTPSPVEARGCQHDCRAFRQSVTHCLSHHAHLRRWLGNIDCRALTTLRFLQLARTVPSGGEDFLRGSGVGDGKA